MVFVVLLCIGCITLILHPDWMPNDMAGSQALINAETSVSIIIVISTNEYNGKIMVSLLRKRMSNDHLIICNVL